MVDIDIALGLYAQSAAPTPSSLSSDPRPLFAAAARSHGSSPGEPSPQVSSTSLGPSRRPAFADDLAQLKVGLASLQLQHCQLAEVEVASLGLWIGSVSRDGSALLHILPKVAALPDVGRALEILAALFVSSSAATVAIVPRLCLRRVSLRLPRPQPHL